MSVAQQAINRRSQARVKRLGSHNYTQRRLRQGTSALGGNVNPFLGKVAKRSK